MKKKGLIISVGRSDYDRYFPILKQLNQSKKIKTFIYLSSDHYEKKFGYSYKFVDKKFNIISNKTQISKKNKIENFTRDIFALRKKIKAIQPDFIVVLGDRYEMLIGPIISIQQQIPLFHFYGGAVTEGSADELVRHAISKMSHYHFVATNNYKKRLIQLGEEKWRIIVTGVLSLNNIKKEKFLTKKELSNFYNFNFFNPYALLTYHPTTHELQNLRSKIQLILKSIKNKKLNLVVTYPNSDHKHETIIKFIEKNLKNKKGNLLIKNCGYKRYISLVKNSEFMIGNSSSGIVESATLKVPSLNIGSRQKGKIIPKNVVSCKYNEKDILRNIEKVHNKTFKKKLKKLKNPYENNFKISNMPKIILKILKNKNLLKKKFKDF